MKEYLNLIDSFIEGKISFKEIESGLWYEYAILDDKSLKLNGDEISFMEDVYERSTFSDTFVPEEDKKDGLMDEDEYRKWLIDYKAENIKFWKEE